MDSSAHDRAASNNQSEPMLPGDPPLAQPVQGIRPLAPSGRRIIVPLLLYATTAVSVYRSGDFLFHNVRGALIYAVAVMFILTTHELGHFLQALRYGVPASLPYFIPMPFNLVGTMGAVIGMRAHVGHRRALFDIGITGPLAGLVPALGCCVIVADTHRPWSGA